MTAVAPGGALHEGPPRPRALLPALGPLRPVLRPVLGPVVRPVRPVLAPVLRAALPAHLRSRPFLPPVTRAAAPRVPVPAAPLDDLLPGGPATPVDGAAAPTGGAARRATTPRQRLTVLLAGAGGGLVAVVAVLLSPLGAVSAVEVRGAAPRWEAAVRAAVAGDVGSRALLLDTGDVAARVVAVPGVHAVSVAVRWPGTLVVEVDERAAAAAVPVGDGVRLLDARGVDLGPAQAAPAGVPQVVVGPGPGVVATRVDGAAVAAAVAARAQLPPALAGQVVRTGATGADGVWFVLRGGARVQWGSADRAGEKADVLAALLAAVPGARRYDVSAPDAPAVTPR